MDVEDPVDPEDAAPMADGEEDVEEPPLTFKAAVSEIAGGLLALFLISVGVLALYVAGGVFLGIVTWAAPAVAAVSAGLILARYLSRDPK